MGSLIGIQDKINKYFNCLFERIQRQM